MDCLKKMPNPKQIVCDCLSQGEKCGFYEVALKIGITCETQMPNGTLKPWKK